MRYIVKAKIRTLLAQQSGHIQLLIFAPILTLFLLSLVVRTANSAIDPTLEKKKITQQLKQRLFVYRWEKTLDIELKSKSSDLTLAGYLPHLILQRSNSRMRAFTLSTSI